MALLKINVPVSVKFLPFKSLPQTTSTLLISFSLSCSRVSDKTKTPLTNVTSLLTLSLKSSLNTNTQTASRLLATFWTWYCHQRELPYLNVVNHSASYNLSNATSLHKSLSTSAAASIFSKDGSKQCAWRTTKSPTMYALHCGSFLTMSSHGLILLTINSTWVN